MTDVLIIDKKSQASFFFLIKVDRAIIAPIYNVKSTDIAQISLVLFNRLATISHLYEERKSFFSPEGNNGLSKNPYVFFFFTSYYDLRSSDRDLDNVS